MTKHFELTDADLDQVTGGGKQKEKEKEKPSTAIEVLSWSFLTDTTHGDDDDDSNGGLLIPPKGP